MMPIWALMILLGPLICGLSVATVVMIAQARGGSPSPVMPSDKQSEEEATTDSMGDPEMASGRTVDSAAEPPAAEQQPPPRQTGPPRQPGAPVRPQPPPAPDERGGDDGFLPASPSPPGKKLAPITGAPGMLPPLQKPALQPP
jgi:hypothetical protein